MDRTPVVPIQPAGSRRPFFYLHVHWQGGAFYCFNIARALGPDQPFYVFDPYRYDDLPAPPGIETMAADYIAAMRHYHRRSHGKPAAADPLAEDWQPAFAIVEPGASVDPGAHVHDSVVLKGGAVEKGAVIVRSIVCPGGVVKKDRPAVDQLVCGEN